MPNNPAFSLISEKLEERIANNQLEVPMLPEVASKVVRLTQDVDSQASDLAKLIQSDQTLAGSVMRVANSAAYSPNSSIISLQQAIARLGMKLIAEIALSASINTRLFNTPGYESHVAYEIKYSLAAGLWAKEVARACRKNVEAAFLAGLLHDIGRPVTIQCIIEIAAKFRQKLSKEDTLALENQFHYKVGLHVIQRWEMPASVVQCVRYFPNYSEPHVAQTQTMIVVAGALLASHFMCEEGNGAVCTPIEVLKDHPVFADLNLYPDQIDQLIAEEAKVNSALEAMTT